MRSLDAKKHFARPLNGTSSQNGETLGQSNLSHNDRWRD
jgi:hypothetical protein